mmetsp:Transcript_8197/g.23434  ORF Transcript_8197/g.23434 Transcript_8197/m.23434 type:complete len:255 (-) Transcript_8197:171-935(-)
MCDADEQRGAAPQTPLACMPGTSPQRPGPSVQHEAGRLAAELGALTMPVAAVKRIGRSVAPEAAFSSEAIAALHRIGQAFVCYATDRVIHEMQAESDRAGAKRRGKNAPLPKKTMGSEHVLHMLSDEFPAMANKLSTLFSDVVPQEYRPEPVRLLEQLRAQELPERDGSAEVPGGESASAGRGLKKRRSETDEAAVKKLAKTARHAAPASLSKMFGLQRQPGAATEGSAMAVETGVVDNSTGGVTAGGHSRSDA